MSAYTARRGRLAQGSFRAGREQFRLRCDSRNLSTGTLSWYEQVLGGFERFLAEEVEIRALREVTPGHLRAYLSDRRQSGISSETIHRTYGGLRCFFKFLKRDGIIERNPMELVERPRRERHFIRPMETGQAKALLEQPDPQSFLGLRNKVMMLLMLDPGLRLSEVLGLRLEQIDLAASCVIVMGKGRKERQVPFADKVKAELARYLRRRARIKTTLKLLFVSKRGRRLSGRHVQIFMKRYGREARIRGVRVSPHTLRHTFATEYIRNGGDVFSLQEILGHSTLEMVRNYVNLARKDVAAQHRKFSPAERML